MSDRTDINVIYASLSWIQETPQGQRALDQGKASLGRVAARITELEEALREIIDHPVHILGDVMGDIASMKSIAMEAANGMERAPCGGRHHQ